MAPNNIAKNKYVTGAIMTKAILEKPQEGKTKTDACIQDDKYSFIGYIELNSNELIPPDKVQIDGFWYLRAAKVKWND